MAIFFMGILGTGRRSPHGRGAAPGFASREIGPTVTIGISPETDVDQSRDLFLAIARCDFDDSAMDG
jgi:hypothetical protein